MQEVYLYRSIAALVSLLPILILFAIGPKITSRRLVYAFTGLLTAGIIGLILNFISLDTRFEWSNFFIARLNRDLLAAFTEEVIRYPGILLAQVLAARWLVTGDEGKHIENNSNKFSEKSTGDEVVTEELSTRFVEGDFTTIIDPHGMALYFGTFYGMGETFAFYIIPTLQSAINGMLVFDLGQEIRDVSLRITAVMAHIALTYLAMAITSNRGFWRVTILLHMAANASNRIFTELNPNYLSLLLFIFFTRFAIVLVAYYLLRPRVRYLSPAILVFLLVCLFLLIILIFTFIALLIGLLTSNIINPIDPI